MKNVRKVATLSVVATALSLAGCGVGTPLTGNMNGTQNAAVNAVAVPGEIIVKFRSGVSASSINTMSAQLGMKQVRVNNAGIRKMTVAGNTQAAIEKLKQNPNVVYAEPNYEIRMMDYTVQKVVNDPDLAKQWAIAKVGAAEAWDVTMGTKNTLLAIVDTGIDYNHPDLAGRVDKGRDFINNDDDAMDDQGHGTHCAGIAAASANDGVGIAGLAPNVSLLAVKVLSAQGGGSNESVASGIVYAADKGSHIISLSLGGGYPSQAIQDAVNYANSKGALVIAAMGNNGRESKSYPAACDGVMAVGATDINDARASFSQYGSWISVGAPGHNILSTIPGNKYAVYSGTSMATPYAAGLASLVKSQFPSMNAAQIKAKIEKSATDVGETGFDKMFGHGRINAAAAVK